jgi:hypothetical protein
LQTIPGFVEITIPNLIRNFPGAPVQDVWYSTALANSIAGVDLNPEEADFDLVVNPSNNWYYGLDGNCPPGSFDFITEMMKGVAYGIGYLSSFYVQNGYGTYGALDPSVLGSLLPLPGNRCRAPCHLRYFRLQCPGTITCR